MKTLVVTSEPEFWNEASIAGSWVVTAEAMSHQGFLYVDDQAVADFDLFVIDSVAEVSAVHRPSHDTALINERRELGAGLIVFAESTALRGFPAPKGQREVPEASRVEFVKPGPISDALRVAGDSLTYRIDWPRSDESIVVNGLGRAIAEMHMGVLYLPAFDHTLRPLVLERLFTWAPDLFDTERVEGPAPPSWVSEVVDWPRAQEMRRRVESSEAQLETARGAAEDAAITLKTEHRWVDLLWAQGKDHLQPLVQDALVELGIRVVDGPREPEELHDFELETLNELLILEVTGTSGEVRLDKGRQLADWVSRAKERLVEAGKTRRVIGTLIANAHRLGRPEERPEPFGQHLRTRAVQEGWHLVTTREIYDLVTSDDPSRNDQARVLLGLSERAESN